MLKLFLIFINIFFHLGCLFSSNDKNSDQDSLIYDLYLIVSGNNSLNKNTDSSSDSVPISNPDSVTFDLPSLKIQSKNLLSNPQWQIVSIYFTEDLPHENMDDQNLTVYLGRDNSLSINESTGELSNVLWTGTFDSNFKRFQVMTPESMSQYAVIAKYQKGNFFRWKRAHSPVPRNESTLCENATPMDLYKGLNCFRRQEMEFQSMISIQTRK